VKNSSRPIIVIDTNVWISGLIFGGKPEKVLQSFIDGLVNVVISEELLSELRRKIRQRFPLYAPKLSLLEASIREQALLVPLGSLSIIVSRDKNDNMVIETAVIGKTSCIVSGDKDLLALGSYKNITILKPAEFLLKLAA
jgi:putative PIN family toxin of toxin-antitoxin system